MRTEIEIRTKILAGLAAAEDALNRGRSRRVGHEGAPGRERPPNDPIERVGDRGEARRDPGGFDPGGSGEHA